jgi:N-acetylglucosamine-6-sulfatase
MGPRDTHRPGWGCLLLLALCLLLAFAPRAEAKPNLLLIVTDDQRYDSLAVMPSTRENFNVDFKTAIVTTPLCCPSRTSILTGEYAHNHGVKTNLDAPIFTARGTDSLGPWLQEQGYFTGLVGRYLNKYSFTDPLPAGFDEAHYMTWDEAGNRLGNFHTVFTLREFWKDAAGDAHDEVVDYPNDTNPNPYATRVYGALGARFVRRAHDPAINPEEKPWALVLWPTAPHAPLIVEPRYSDALVPRWTPAPSVLEENLRDKPREVRKLATSHGRSYYVNRRNKTLRMLMSVDDLVERIWDTVDDYGERPNTWGIYSSDNGFLFGEHRLNSKLLAYEESARVPFRMAVPGVGPEQIGRSIVANIDIAPTLTALAGAPPRESFDGRSLLPLLSGECFCGRRLLIENWLLREYQAVRAPHWKYVRWPSGAEELYDLKRDPYELENVARRPSSAAVLDALRTELDSLLLE